MPELLEPESFLFRPESTNPSGQDGAWTCYELTGHRMHFDPDAPAAVYNRSFKDYCWELNNLFNPLDWIGKRVLDVGTGAYDRFGREAREMGIDVVGINPALMAQAEGKNEDRARLQQAVAYDQKKNEDAARDAFAARPRWRRMFSGMAEVAPAYPRVVGAVAQSLPFQNEIFDAVVSVYGVPHYLHHVDPTNANDADILAASNLPGIREKDKQQIRLAFSEIARVLRPGGKAFLADNHRSPNQVVGAPIFSPSDGTEVVEVLQELQEQGVEYKIFEEPMMGEGRGVKRIIILQKLTV